MMNERVDRVKMLRVSKYDGQAIYVNNEVLYELGGYLGGGVAGVYVDEFIFNRHVLTWLVCTRQ